MKADLYNFESEKTGTLEVPEVLFGARWNAALVHQVLLAQLANARHPWAHAKGRGEVRGGGRKPWRQKGTGRARHGSIRSPLWPGGGKSHGPQKERDYTQKVNKKMRRAAIASVLSKKLDGGAIRFVDAMALPEAKTKMLAARLERFVSRAKGKKAFDALLVPAPGVAGIYRAGKNLQKTKVISAGSLNVYDLMNYRTILIDQAAIPAIAKAYTS